MVRGKGDEAGICKFTYRLCDGGRVDTEPGGKIGGLHRPVAFRNIPEAGHFPGERPRPSRISRGFHYPAILLNGWYLPKFCFTKRHG